jgi:hypothetical protein
MVSDHLESAHRLISKGIKAYQSFSDRFWRIVLKKSFSPDERNFLGLLIRFACVDVRDHIVSLKNDYGPS